jgi:hypothetical protein
MRAERRSGEILIEMAKNGERQTPKDQSYGGETGDGVLRPRGTHCY